MVFKLVLKHVFKAETEEEKLKASVIYGWSLLAIAGLCVFLADIVSPSIAEMIALLFFVVMIMFITRYNSVKPLLGAASAGITIITFTALLESIFSRRNNASATMGAIFGVLIGLFLLVVKNCILSLFYLSRETFRFINYKTKDATLEKTI